MTSTSKAVTPFAGLCSFIAWLRQIDFLDQTTRALPFSYVSPNAIPIADTFTAFLLSVVVGAPRFAHCDWLRFDSALHTLLGFKRFPGDDAILRFFVRFTQDYVEARSFAPVSAGWRLRCLPADSGFFDQALLAMLEAHAVPYIIVARLTTARKRRLHSSALVWRDLGKGYAVSSFTLKLYGWSDTRRFVVLRELEREDKSAVGRRLIDVPGYTFRVWVTNRTEDAATL